MGKMALVYSRPAGLARVNDPNFLYPVHLEAIEDLLMEVYFGKLDRLLLSCPPRHGKSELISKYFPAWWILHRPKDRIILASYEASFAETWGRKVREIVEEYGQYFGVFLRKDSKRASSWETTEGGGMYTAGVGGPITGKGANLLILDDPIKNAEQALSNTYREKTWDWFNSTAYTRIEPGGAVIVMHTRWHEDDLAGRLGNTGKYLAVNFPAIADQEDTLGRDPGEALWPKRFPVDTLLEIKEQIGSYWFNALYQGRPSPPEGSIIKREWFRHYEDNETPLGGFWIQSWDLTFKDTKDGSFICGQVWARDGANFYLIDQVRFRGDFVETIDRIKNMVAKYPKTRAVLVEDKANGPAVISSLKREIPGIVPVDVKGSKEARAHAVSPLFESGNVWVPKGKKWLGEYIEEMITFPAASHDDQMDATSQALDYLRSKGRMPRTPKASNQSISNGRKWKGWL